MKKPTTYSIRVEGHLEDAWSDWFGGMTLVRLPDGTTVLTGLVEDQSALHGLLLKLHNMGLPLIACDQIGDHTSSQNLKSTQEDLQ